MAALPLVLLVPLVCGRTLVCSQYHNLGIGESQSFCFPDPAHSQRAWEPTHVVHVVPQVSGRLRTARGGPAGGKDSGWSPALTLCPPPTLKSTLGTTRSGEK